MTGTLKTALVVSRSLGLILLVVLALLNGATASAHRVAAPMTVISPNARTGLWEVVHRMSVHDVEPLAIAAGAAMSGPDGEAALARFAGSYVAGRFGVAGDASPIELSFVGAEVDGDFVFVYFEFASPDQTVLLTNSIMVEDAESFGAALVNVENGAGGVETGVFSAENRVARAQLCFETCD